MANCVSTIINRRISNPHLRIGFIEFIFYLIPMKNVDSSQEKENNMYKNDFFNNIALKKYLMLALILVYSDSEKTDWYGRFHFRYYSANIMEFIWQDKDFRQSFIDLPRYHPQDFSMFCNFLINDINSMLFEGLLALQSVKEFEDLKESDGG